MPVSHFVHSFLGVNNLKKATRALNKARKFAKKAYRTLLREKFDRLQYEHEAVRRSYGRATISSQHRLDP
jgi:hypothetical protein